MSSILVTGSHGVIGSSLTPVLRSRGHQVFGVDLTHSAEEGEMWSARHQRENCSYARCDVGEFRQLERVFETHGPFEFVYHAAAEFGRWNGEDYYEQLWRTNVIGTKHILTLQKQLAFKLIQFSSSEIYGDYSGVMDETVPDRNPIHHLNDYAMSKWVNEQQICNSRTLAATKSVIVRLFNTYGPGEAYHPYRSMLARLCYGILSGLPVKVYRGHSRTCSYITDTCQTLANIVENFCDGEVYNIAGSQEHRTEDITNLIVTLANGDPSLVVYCDKEPLTTTKKSVDAGKARRDLGHTTTVDLQTGIARTIDWMVKRYDFHPRIGRSDVSDGAATYQ